MIKANVATQISVPGKETISILNTLEASGVTTVHLDMTSNPDNIKTVKFNTDAVLKLLLVKTKDNKYEVQEEGDPPPEPKYIRYRFKGGRGETWVPLKGPLCVIGEDKIKSLNDNSELKKMFFKNEFGKDVSLELLMFADVVSSEGEPEDE